MTAPILDSMMIAVIDQRIKANQRQLSAWGTVAQIDGDSDAQVVLDSTEIAIPAKMSGSVWCYEGDRVGLLLIEKHWTIVATTVRRWPATAGASNFQTAGGTTTSSSYGDTPIVTADTFVKRWDGSTVLAWLTGGAAANAVPTQVEWALEFVSPDTGTFVYPMAYFNFNVANVHAQTADVEPLASLPASTYTVTAQWRRVSGTGTLTSDQNDVVAFAVMEAAP
jgi:hypothetical protein